MTEPKTYERVMCQSCGAPLPVDMTCLYCGTRHVERFPPPPLAHRPPPASYNLGVGVVCSTGFAYEFAPMSTCDPIPLDRATWAEKMYVSKLATPEELWEAVGIDHD